MTNSVERLTKVMPSTSKFLLMGSDGVAAPGDDDRTFGDQVVLFLLRYLITPQVDNEEAAAHLMKVLGTAAAKSTPEWCIVRPTDLQDGPAQDYTLYTKPIGGLFGSGIVSRATVAKFMMELIREEKVWAAHKHQCPVIHDQVANPTESAKP